MWTFNVKFHVWERSEEAERGWSGEERWGEIRKDGRDHKIGRHRKGLEISGRGQWWDGHTGWKEHTRKRHASYAKFLLSQNLTDTKAMHQCTSKHS